jgi:hypothetical protein
MKINFQATFKELSSVIRAPRRLEDGVADSSRFTKLLSSVSPDAQQPSEFITENSKLTDLSKPSVGIERQPMARFNFSEPTLKFNELARLSPNKIEEEVVKEAPFSVKTPAILDARRIGEETARVDAVQQKIEPQFAPEDIKASLAPSFQPPIAEPKPFDKIANIVTEAGKKHGVDPSLSMAVASAESAFDTRAVSADGHASKGLFQLLDSTGKDLFERTGESGEYEPFDPQLNANLGVGYLRYLHDLFSKPTALPNSLRTVAAANSSSLEKLAVAAFNAGEGRVASAQRRADKAGLDPSVYENVEGYLPENTQEYVRKVMRGKGEFEGRIIG